MVLSYFWLDLLVSCGFERGGSIKFRSLQEPLPTIASKHRYHPPRQGHHSCLGWWYWASAAAHCRSAHALGGEPPWKNPTMGNVFHQKKNSCLFIEKGGVMSKFGTPTILDNVCVQLLWSIVFMAKHDHCSRCPSSLRSVEDLASLEKLSGVKLPYAGKPSTGSTAHGPRIWSFNGVPPKYSKHSSMKCFFFRVCSCFKSWDSRISLWIITSSYIEISIKPWLSLTINWG